MRSYPARSLMRAPSPREVVVKPVADLAGGQIEVRAVIARGGIKPSFSASSRNHSRRPGLGHQHHRLHGLPHMDREEAYKYVKQSFSSRCARRLAHLSNERAAENNSSAITTTSGD
jgi:hypothetical protein